MMPYPFRNILCVSTLLVRNIIVDCVFRTVMSTQYNAENLTGFVYHDPEAVHRKLASFALAGANSMSCVFDFDRTLTTSKHTGEDITTWYILHGLLPEIGKQAMKDLHAIYQPKELSGELTEADALTWWNSALQLYVDHPVYFNQIEQAARDVQLRDGTTELFKTCEAAGIPTIILSAGVGDVIEIICERRSIHPTAILSTKLALDTDGRILGWDRESMVHVLNKHEQDNDELTSIRAKRPYTILLGDSLQDVDMAQGTDNVLRIRMCDRTVSDPAAREQYLQQSFAAGFDMVLEEDLAPLVQLTKWLTTNR